MHFNVRSAVQHTRALVTARYVRHSLTSCDEREELEGQPQHARVSGRCGVSADTVSIYQSLVSHKNGSVKGRGPLKWPAGGKGMGYAKSRAV